jgi:hypothetical protein
VREELGKKVGILKPHPRPSRALLPHIDFIKPIRAGVLRVSQFPETVIDAHGRFTKPAAWARGFHRRYSHPPPTRRYCDRRCGLNPAQLNQKA